MKEKKERKERKKRRKEGKHQLTEQRKWKERSHRAKKIATLLCQSQTSIPLGRNGILILYYQNNPSNANQKSFLEI